MPALQTPAANPGPGARVAAKRREWVRMEEVRLADERRAIWVSNIRQMGVVRRGQFMVP